MNRLCCLVAVVLFAAVPAHSAEWSNDVVLYGWMTGLEGEMGIGDAATAPVGATFTDLVKFLDFAMAVHYEATEPRARFITDIAYFNLGAERDATILKQDVKIDMDLQEWVIEFGGGYRITPEVDLILAGRWYRFDFGAASTSEFGSSSAEDTHNWGDVYAGARYTKTYAKSWTFSVRGDIGAGGSELAWFGNALVSYSINEFVSAGIAYRVLSLDREPTGDDYLLYDVTQGGFGIGVGFRF